MMIKTSTTTTKAETTTTPARPKRKATNAHIFRYLQTGNPNRLEESDLRKALEASLEDCPGDFFWPAEDSASCGSSDQCNGCNIGAMASGEGTGTPTSLLSSSESSSASSAASTSSSTGVKTGSTPTSATIAALAKNYISNSAHRRRKHNTNCQHRNPNQTRPNNNRAAPMGKRRRSSTRSNLQRNHLCHHHQHNINQPCNQHCPTNSTMHHQNSTSSHTANHNCCPLSTSVQSRYKPVAKKTIYHEADFFHEGIMEYIEYVLLNSQRSSQ